MLMFAPSLVMVAFGVSSMAAGLMLFLLCLYVYLTFDFVEKKQSIRFNFNQVTFYSLLAIFFLLHSMVAMIKNSNFQFERFLTSYLAFSLICIGACGFVSLLTKIRPTDLSRWIGGAVWFLVVNAMFGLTGIAVFSNATHKPVGIFSEPSHLALVLAPMLAYSCAINAKNHRKFLLFFFVWGLLIENLTTLVVVGLCFLIRLKINFSRKFVLSAFVFVIIAGVIIQLTDLDYFSSRLKISSDSDNLSVLVLIQGWETAFLMLMETNGVGSGFQQYGFSTAVADVSAKIGRFGLEGLNQFDGGSTAAKLIGEFGYFGILLVGMLIILSLKALIRLRLAERTGECGGQLLLSASLYTFIVELLLRGVGYFSPSCFLALCGISFALTKWRLDYCQRVI